MGRRSTKTFWEYLQKQQLLHDRFALIIANGEKGYLKTAQAVMNAVCFTTVVTAENVKNTL